MSGIVEAQGPGWFGRGETQEEKMKLWSEPGEMGMCIQHRRYEHTLEETKEPIGELNGN